MKVLVTNVPAVYRIDLYKLLSSSGWEIFFYARRSKELSYCADQQELPFAFKDVNLISLFFRLLWRRPEVVICINASPYTLVCVLYARLLRKRFVLWWAGTALSEKKVGFLKNQFRRLIFNLTDGFVAYSEFAASYLVNMGVEDEKITVLGNMTFDPVAYRALVDKARSERRLSPPTLLAVANLVKRKNYVFLLQVFAVLRERFQNLELIIAGDGPERGQLEEMIHELGLDGVKLLGHVPHDQMPHLYARADVFVHPATMDQWPQCVNEAMSAGVPVVISKYSGVTQVLLVPGKQFFMPEMSIASFVNAISTILQDEQNKSRLAETAYFEMITLYSSAIKTINRVTSISTEVER